VNNEESKRHSGGGRRFANGNEKTNTENSEMNEKIENDKYVKNNKYLENENMEKENAFYKTETTEDMKTETPVGKKQKKTKKHKALRVLLTIIIIIAIICLSAYLALNQYLNSKLDKIQYQNITTDANELGIDATTQKKMSNFKNIALLGIDAMGDDYGEGNRTDCIMIASINQDTNEVKLFSIYRDTYVQMELQGKTILDKINHAYYDGVANTIKTINTNLDLNITEYVLVNYQVVTDVIDSIGGVDITIESDELQYINQYVDAVALATNKKATHVSKAGTQTLNGVQAVAYSRIRYTSGKDYKRTARMRTVLEAIIQKAQSQGIQKELEILNTILPEAKTNISTSEMKELIPKAVSWKLTANFGWPYKTTGVWMNGDFYGPAVTLESNVKQLHQEVFGEENYEASDTVKAISAAVIKKTGLK
jgi:LCP family protein required for cell wall assembly